MIGRGALETRTPSSPDPSPGLDPDARLVKLRAQIRVSTRPKSKHPGPDSASQPQTSSPRPKSPSPDPRQMRVQESLRPRSKPTPGRILAQIQVPRPSRHPDPHMPKSTGWSCDRSCARNYIATSVQIHAQTQVELDRRGVHVLSGSD